MSQSLRTRLRGLLPSRRSAVVGHRFAAAARMVQKLSWQIQLYDTEAVREPSTGRPSGNKERFIARRGERSRLNTHLGSSIPYQPDGNGRSLRSVWNIPN